MTTPYDPFFKLQIALWEGWVRAMSSGFCVCERLIDQQARILDHQDYFRFHNIIPQGADWLDHYGKRNHDVDVEKV
ncbi:MAG TPA: hypothetical protein VN809_01885 [Telmatospirillum sp.]|nr:hypothetical protein [Telmatospirillum sp.]